MSTPREPSAAPASAVVPTPAPPRWKPIAVLAAVFLLGAVAGGGVVRATALRDIEQTFRGPPREAHAHFRIQAMRRHLGLTDAQLTEIEALFADADAERQRLLSTCGPGLEELRARTEGRVREILTPEQRATYDERKRRSPDPPGPPGRGPRP